MRSCQTVHFAGHDHNHFLRVVLWFADCPSASYLRFTPSLRQWTRSALLFKYSTQLPRTRKLDYSNSYLKRQRDSPFSVLHPSQSWLQHIKSLQASEAGNSSCDKPLCIFSSTLKLRHLSLCMHFLMAQTPPPPPPPLGKRTLARAALMSGSCYPVRKTL